MPALHQPALLAQALSRIPVRLSSRRPPVDNLIRALLGARLLDMSEAAEVSEPPRPSPEQMAEFRAAVERLKAGDESDFLPWEDVAAELGLH